MSDCLAAAIRELLRRRGSNAGDHPWIVEEDSGSPWIWVAPGSGELPQQGWKLHLSATVVSAASVLERALPVLAGHAASFKVARSLAELQSLNEGRSGFSQVGKFITVYPANDADAVRLAAALDERLQGIPHPDIPSDRPLKPRSVVHYRYGSFGQQHVRVPMGQILSALETPDGTLVPDRRSVPYRQPEWVEDPFIAASVAIAPSARPRLLADRYLIVHTLDESARGSIHLGADVVDGKRCLVKRAARDAQVDESGRGAADRLRHEAELLRRLAGSLPVPCVLDVIDHDDEVFLAMQDVEGEPLSEYIQRIAGEGRMLSNAEVAAYGIELAALLARVHERRLIHRDLKSDNVVIGPDRRLWLVDFEIAHDLDGGVASDGRGTEGYMSPQASEGEAATVLDDVYGLGAILYFLATAAEPSWAPADAELIHRPVRLLNPAVSPALSAVIERCLEQKAERRYPDMTAVIEALENSSTALEAGAAGRLERVPANPAQAVQRWLSLAQRLGDSLCAGARRDGSGIFWTSVYDEAGGLERRDLGGGSAGVLLALAELVDEFDDARHRQALIEGSGWLASSTPFGALLPGLYVGESGIAAALLRAGQVLDRSDLVRRAAVVAQTIDAVPHASPDLFHGTAGRLRLNLMLWQETGASEHLGRAVSAGDYLIEQCDRVADGQARWIIPPGYEDLSGDAYLGYAHGAAGIGDALLDLYLAGRDERFLDASLSAARWLIARAVRRDDQGLNWPALDAPADRPAGAFWCHGAAGIGRFFVNLANASALPEALDVARAAALTVAAASRRVGPTQCHGIAGNIEFLLDMFQATGDESFLSDARNLATILETFSRDRDDGLVWVCEAPRVVTPDYMVGYAGVAVCLLRLASPHDRPHGLSLRGFRWRPPRREISVR